MKKFLFLLLSLSIILPSCKDDDPIVENALQYDGENQNAPVFETGTSEAAVYFPASYTQDHVGKNLINVTFYLRDIPATTILSVLGPGTSSTPGSEIFSVDLSDDVQGNSWNQYNFLSPIEITGEDLWLALKVTHNNTGERSVGCDAGPANSNGDWIFHDSDNEWKTLRNRTNNAVDINWNIRGNLSE